MKGKYMNFLKIVAVTGFLFVGTMATYGQSTVFSCQAPPAGFVPGLTAELQRQSVTVSGVIYVNCCATEEYTSELNNGVLKVTLATTGPCDCLDHPCLIELSLSTGVSAVPRVTVVTAENATLLDTSFVQTGLSGNYKTIANNAPSGTAKIFDLRGRALSGGGERPLDVRRKRLPRGAYLIADPDCFITIAVQP